MATAAPPARSTPPPAIVETAPPARVETASPPVAPPADPPALPPASSSTSIGSPTNGHLEGGVALPLKGPGFRFNSRRESDARYGTVETIRAIMSAAAEVERDLPGSELVVNDISLQAGGRIPHHGSHRAGRDADILFFLTGDDGQPIEAVGAPLDPDGIGYDYKDLSRAEDDVRVHFDAPRSWRFLRALIEQPGSEIQRIFVVEHLRARLLDEAERSGASSETIARFADLTCQPGYAHDDHFHVRWFCSAEDLRAGCEDAQPIYPWRVAELARQGVQPVAASRTTSEDPAPVVTEQQAERAVMQAAPHPDVVAFLKRRKAWTKQPHPGRPYCR